ncbi:MAG: hypothetical protein HOV83_25165 [Catenulispora sp.]|nr:hypothetical protein [Catenulispora sp.]
MAPTVGESDEARGETGESQEVVRRPRCDDQQVRRDVLPIGYLADQLANVLDPSALDPQSGRVCGHEHIVYFLALAHTSAGSPPSLNGVLDSFRAGPGSG